MNQRQTPFLVGLAAAAAVVLRGPVPPAVLPPGAGQAATQLLAAAAKSGTMEAPLQRAAGSDSAGVQASRREYARLYRDLLGIDAPQPPRTGAGTTRVRGKVAAQPINLELSAESEKSSVSDADLREIAQAARNSGDRLEFMIALVVDPIDSGLASDFDLSMSALQLSLADSGYRLNRQWLPWVEPEAVEAKLYRETAGLMLFHRDREATPELPISEPHLLAVFLVGETLKLGIHKPAFERAVDFILDLHTQDRSLPMAAAPGRAATSPAVQDTWCPEIPVMGPSSSGSVTSLRLALAHAPRHTCFRIVSGSASAPRLKYRLEAPLAVNPEVRVRFSRTVVPDDILARLGLRFLQNRLGWNLHRAAMLVENDTAYGSYFSGLAPDSAPDPRLSGITKLWFPSGLYALRNAWEASGGFARPPGTAGNPNAAASPKTALEVSLADPRVPVDVVPELSPLTARIADMAIADLLREISGGGFSYIGILATDVKDQLFLAEQVRRWAPSAILFVVDNNLLYVHPQYSTAMFGTVTISSFPLATEGEWPALSPAGFEPRMRRQFASERQEGIFLAVRSLLRGEPYPPRAVWIAASGNYAMWPLASLQIPEAELAKEFARPPAGYPANVDPLCPHSGQDPAASARPPAPKRVPGRLTGRVDLKLAFLAFVVCLVGYLLREEAFSWAKCQLRTPLLIHIAAALLCLAGAFILGFWIVRLVAGWESGEPIGWGAWLLLLWLLLCYGWLVGCLITIASRYASKHISAWTLLGLALQPALIWVVFTLWRVDASGLFYLRASAFSGGVSPLVSLAWFAVAAFFWIVVELKRQVVRKRHGARWPLARYDKPALAGCGTKVEEIDQVVNRTLPRGWRPWLEVAAIVAPPIVFLWSSMQPIGESRCYGRIFVLLGAGLSALSAIAFLRFLRSWWRLRFVLRWVAATDLLAALKRVAGDMCWNPTQFTWHVPSFTTLRQSVERLQTLIDREVVRDFARPLDPRLIERLQQIGCDPDDAKLAWPPDLHCLLECTFAATAHDDLEAEMRLREELNHRFELSGEALAERTYQQEVKEFYAVRLIAYLRDLFGQLRYSVMGAMGCGLSLIIGTSTYSFQPKEFATLVLWATLAAASIAMLMVFVEMERDGTLSAIAGTDPGKVTYNWSFVSKILIYNVLPVVGLVASQFPSIGRIFNSLLDPLVRVLGSG